MESSAGDSMSWTFAARPETCTVSPERFGTSNVTGLLLVSAANCQPGSATTKKLLASGTTAQLGDTSSVLALFAAMLLSWPAPRPRVIHAVAPRYRLSVMLRLSFPIADGP